MPEDSFSKLREIVTQLRAPGGCPWDREQTNESLLPALIEEAYEVAGAVRAENDANFREELGDLLLLIIMHAEIAREASRFDIQNVLSDVTEKLVRRHPHVFGKSDARDSGAVLKQWESIKRAEKTRRHYLDGLPAALPALMRAQKAQSKAARVNFDWTELRDVIAKIEEEVAEAKSAISSQDRQAIEDEIGDLLFAVVNLARKCKLDAESTLQTATDKFVARFNRLEGESQGRLCLVRAGAVALDGSHDWHSHLKETDHSKFILRRTIGIETEIIESTPADRICVWVLRKRLAAPSQRAPRYHRCPGGAAVAGVSRGSIVCPSRFLGRRMKPYISDAASRRDSEGLNPAIQILVIDRVLIVPNSSGWVCHFIANECNAIVSRIGLDLIDGCSGPGKDGRLRSYRGSNGRKCEIRASADTELTIGDVVVHVALPGISLAPGVFMWSDVLTFSEIGATRILRCVQVAHCHRDPVRRACVSVAGVVGRAWRSWEDAGKGIHPRA